MLRIFVACTALLFSFNSLALEVIDFEDHTVTLAAPAQRIVALSPHLVENLFSLGSGAQIVGRVDFADFPAEASSIPVVGAYASTNIEAIIALEPDLIVAWASGNKRSTLEKLKQLGYPLYLDEPRSFDDIAKSLRDLGTLSGHPEKGRELAEYFLKEIEKFRTQSQSKKEVTSFYQIWNSPLQTVNGKHLISAVLDVCAARNIFAEEKAIAPTVNIEAVLERNPDLLIASGNGGERPEWLDAWKAYPSLNFVENKKIFVVHADYLQRHTLRLLKGVEQVCAAADSTREGLLP